MRHLKNFKIYESSHSFDDIIKMAFHSDFYKDNDGYHFKNNVWVTNQIISDGIDQGVLPKNSLEKLPIKIASVPGGLNLYDMKLKTLEGCPEKVNGYFDCSGNNLTNLKHGPKHVEDTYTCHKSGLKSLEGSPEEVYSLYVESNKLKNLIGGPKSVERNFYLDRNPLESLKGIPKNIKGTISLAFCDDTLKSLKGLHGSKIGKVHTSYFSLDWDFGHIFDHLMKKPENALGREYLLTYFEDRKLSEKEEDLFVKYWEDIDLDKSKINLSPDKKQLLRVRSKFI